MWYLLFSIPQNYYFQHLFIASLSGCPYSYVIISSTVLSIPFCLYIMSIGPSPAEKIKNPAYYSHLTNNLDLFSKHIIIIAQLSDYCFRDTIKHKKKNNFKENTGQNFSGMIYIVTRRLRTASLSAKMFLFITTVLLPYSDCTGSYFHHFERRCSL